jgi:putative oxidoreductase
MNDFGASKVGNELLLVGRILLMALFLIFGWGKLMNFGGTEGYFAHIGTPMPVLATAIAVIMEVFVALAIIIGFLTRPLALLMALYTFGTALIGHHYWTVAGPEHMESMINFYKNVSIIGGLFVLYVSGAGRYSVDSALRLA